MADEVINGLENMRLTTEEEEVITISDEGRKEEIESCALSLVGKFLTCKPFNKRAAQNTLRRAWSLEEGVHIIEVGSNLFQFKFSREFDLDRVLNEGPWSFDNQVLMLRRWQPGMTAANVKFDSVALWIQIWGAPFDMSSSKVAAEIGSRLGEVVGVDKRKVREGQNLFMRVKVAVPISKPLRRGGFIGGSDGQRSWVNYKYERLPLFCHFCGLLGHDLKHCAEYYARSKHGSEVLCQYGEWMKSAGSRSRSPVRTGSNKYYGDRTADRDGGVNLKQAAAAEEINQANPTGTNGYEFGKGVYSGHSPDFVEEDSVTEGNIKEGGGPSMSVTEAEKLDPSKGRLSHELALNQVDGLTEGAGESHVASKMQNGLQASTPKPTWTRLVRMECGPSMAKQVPSKSLLGKRRVQEANFETDTANNEKNGKRGRLQEEEDHNETAGVQEHPCRAQ